MFVSVGIAWTTRIWFQEVVDAELAIAKEPGKDTLKGRNNDS
jgi:hypothetical protein